MKRQNTDLAGFDFTGRSSEKRSRAKRPTKTRGQNLGKIQSEVMRIKKQLLIAKPPIKSIFNEFTGSYENDFLAVGLAWPKQGTNPDERVGADIRLKSINIRGTFYYASSDNYDTVRFTVVQFLDGNTDAQYPFGSSANSVAKVWMSNNSDYPTQMPFNSQTTQSYRILYDEVMVLSLGSTPSAHRNILITAKDLAVKKLHFNNAVSNLNPPIVTGN